ncbi:MAG: tyrosine-protein phosphatase [Candidatus Scatosoma sp.]
MTDLHTHILPFIDDGAQDKETSAGMLQALRAQGVNSVVFTPHYYGRVHSPRAFLRKRKESYEAVKDALPRGMNVRLGAEVHFSDALASNEHSALLCIEGTRYMLLELPFTAKWDNLLFKKLRYFIDISDCVPIVAHFCRYEEVRKNPEVLSELYSMGCLLQADASAFLHPKDRRLVFAAMKHGLVHCIGSDCHNLSTRPPVYKEAVDAAKNAGFGEETERIQETMRDILADREIIRKPCRPVKKFFTSFR